ncbi:MAG: glycosyltransferase, partial [Chitinophagaceae bacterium]
MKVLFIHNHYKLAGGEDIAVKLQEELFIRKGDDVRVVLFDNSEISSGFPLVTGINSIYNKNSKQQIAKEIASFRPDVIHIHNLFFLASPSVLFAASEAKVPVIFTLHNFRLICCNAFLLRDQAICELCTQKTLPFSGIRYKCYRSSHVHSALVTAITSAHKLMGTWKNKVNTYIALTEFGKAKFLNSS